MPRALITGGSAGLGRALAAGLADQGWEVVVTGRDPQKLDAAAAALGPRVVPVAGDVPDPAHREAPQPEWFEVGASTARLVNHWHDPQASHLPLVEAIAGEELTQAAYDSAVESGYRWHEFGDSALFLPCRATAAAA